MHDRSVDEITTTRLRLEPLRVEHAHEMLPVLAGPEMYRFIGGTPPSIEELIRRYEFQAGGSPRPEEWWLNWIIREDGEACGFVQATVVDGEADVAWLIGVRWQGRGFAKEAAAAMVSWLSDRGVTRFVADVHPRHIASQRVAASLGLEPTDEMVDGERRWRLTLSDDPPQV